MKNRLIKALCPVAAAALLFTGCSATNSAEVDKMQKQLDTLQKYIEVNMKADLDNWDGSYVGVGDSSVHKIVDDTPIIEAYKSGDDSKLTEEEKYTLDTAKKVLEDLKITEDMSEYDKEKAVYDWQVQYVAYDSTQQSAIPSDINISDYNYYPYGVLKYHQAICVGNATTFKLFMDMLGIDCQIIHSTSNGEHAWNLVKIDGDWYHVDVTFDNGDGKTPGYSFFNVPDSVKQNGGYPWNAEDFPAATSYKYCYAYLNHVEIDDLYGLPQAVKDAIDANQASLFVSTKDMSEVDYSLVDSIGAYTTGYFVYLNNTYSFEDGTVIYNIQISKQNNDEPIDEQPKYDYDKMQKELEDVFGSVAVG